MFSFGYLFGFIVSLIWIQTTNGEYSTKWKCDNSSQKEIDHIVARMMLFGQSDRKFPISQAQMRGYCKEQNALISKLEDYKTQCLKGTLRSTVAVIIYSIRSQNNMICKNMASKRVKNLLKSAVCANDASNEYNKCNINYIDLLLDVENSKDSKQKLIHVCCGYVEVFQCVRAKATSFPSCGPDEIEANVNFIRGFFDNANSLICGEYSADSDQCEKVRIIRKPNRHPSKRPESYFNPLVKVISNL